MKQTQEPQYRVIPGMKVFDLRMGSRPDRERVPSKVLTAAYRRFVAPYYATHQPSRALFIGHSIPYLVRNTSIHVACILAGTWFRNHGKGSYGPFMGEAIRAANTTPATQNVPRMRLRSRQHREALAIAAHLSNLADGEAFPLPGRELQLRLLLPHPENGRRILKALVKAGALEIVDAGLSRPAASKLGEKARAATYRVVGGRS